jgi:hypothetical protein
MTERVRVCNGLSSLINGKPETDLSPHLTLLVPSFFTPWLQQMGTVSIPMFVEIDRPARLSIYLCRRDKSWLILLAQFFTTVVLSPSHGRFLHT